MALAQSGPYSNDGKLGGLFLGGSLGSTDGKTIGSNDRMKLVSYDGKVLVTIPVNIYGIRLGIDVGTELGSLDASLDGSNDGSLEGCSCCCLRGLSCHWCLRFTQGSCDGSNCCFLSSLEMVGRTRRGRGVDVWRC